MTARLYPVAASNGEPEEISRRMSGDLLLRGLFLKPAQTVIEAVELRRHAAQLLDDRGQTAIMAHYDRRQDAQILAHRRLFRENTFELSGQKFEGDVLGH